MGNRLYVANLSYQTTESELEEIFQAAGQVTSAQIVKDRETDRSRGFGFVTMETDAAAEEAISKLNGQMLDGRPLRVSEAKPREERPQRTFRDNRGGDSRGGGDHRGGGERRERRF